MINFLDEAKLHINIFFLLMFMTERMFIITGAFLFGYCLVKIKNIKLMTFFQVTIKNMACSIEFLTEKMEEIKITDGIFLGNDLSYEENFLNSVIEKFGK